jgi:hypothetical protein
LFEIKPATQTTINEQQKKELYETIDYDEEEASIDIDIPEEVIGRLVGRCVPRYTC